MHGEGQSPPLPVSLSDLPDWEWSGGHVFFLSLCGGAFPEKYQGRLLGVIFSCFPSVVEVPHRRLHVVFSMQLVWLEVDTPMSFVYPSLTTLAIVRSWKILWIALPRISSTVCFVLLLPCYLIGSLLVRVQMSVMLWFLETKQ